MKHFPIKLISSAIIACFIAYLPVFAGDISISCSHPELCRLAERVFAENHMSGYRFLSLVKIVGDPHEFQPTASEVKSLIKASILISGPKELNPWISKINYQRSKDASLKTINLPMDKNDYALYPLGTPEALSHFWLYPKIFCELKSRLEEQFIAMKMLVILPTKKSCSIEAQKIEKKLNEALTKISTPIILTHDALGALLNSLQTKTNNIVSIKGSGHHQEATTTSVKELYNALSAPKALWIEEIGIKVPPNILAKKRKTDLIIQIDTANSEESAQYFQILNLLAQKLQALTP